MLDFLKVFRTSGASARRVCAWGHAQYLTSVVDPSASGGAEARLAPCVHGSEKRERGACKQGGQDFLRWGVCSLPGRDPTGGRGP